MKKFISSAIFTPVITLSGFIIFSGYVNNKYAQAQLSVCTDIPNGQCTTKTLELGYYNELISSEQTPKDYSNNIIDKAKTFTGLTYEQIDCSHLVHKTFNLYFFGKPELDKNQDPIIPYLTATDGLYKNAKKYFDEIQPENVKVGDLVLFDRPPQGKYRHVGFIESYNVDRQVGKFFGSQTSTGPATAIFTTNQKKTGYYWGVKQKVIKFLRPKETILILRRT
jgi:hypothetical protein